MRRASWACSCPPEPRTAPPRPVRPARRKKSGAAAPDVLLQAEALARQREALLVLPPLVLPPLLLRLPDPVPPALFEALPPEAPLLVLPLPVASLPVPLPLAMLPVPLPVLPVVEPLLPMELLLPVPLLAMPLELPVPVPGLAVEPLPMPLLAVLPALPLLPVVSCAVLLEGGAALRLLALWSFWRPQAAVVSATAPASSSAASGPLMRLDVSFMTFTSWSTSGKDYLTSARACSP